jgi:hypothetical protein
VDYLADGRNEAVDPPILFQGKVKENLQLLPVFVKDDDASPHLCGKKAHF